MKSPKSFGLPRRPKRPVIVRLVQGHSMMPVLPPGTMVFGWRWFRRLRSGNVVIVFHNDKEKIKRIDQIEGNKVYVLGDHPETSTDSRHFGWLDREAVLAKVFWPHSPKHRAEGTEPEAS